MPYRVQQIEVFRLQGVSFPVGQGRQQEGGPLRAMRGAAAVCQDALIGVHPQGFKGCFEVERGRLLLFDLLRGQTPLIIIEKEHSGEAKQEYDCGKEGQHEVLQEFLRHCDHIFHPGQHP